ncbi:MAG: Vitamin B12 import system permease protein BtuC [Desulfovibrio sp.]
MYLLFCDVIARTVLNGQEMPVGIVTSILGVPFFIFLLRRGRKGAA